MSLAPHIQIYCPRCDAVVRVPERLTRDGLRRIIAMRRDGRTLEGIKLLKESTPTDLSEAKCFVSHITSEAGHCHRCHSPLPPAADLCPTCRCANLDFHELK